MKDKNASWFAYVLSIISGIIVLATTKTGTRSVKVHAWQSIWLGIAYIVLYVAFTIIGLIPFMYGFMLFLRYGVGTAWLIISLLCIINAINGTVLKVPLLYDMAEKSA